MPSVNKVILVGRLGQDPTRRETRDRKEYATFSMATSKKWKDQEEKTVWHNVVVWNEHTAHYVNEFARTGSMVYVEGEIESRSYQKDGQTHYGIDIVVTAFDGKVQILADPTPRDGSVTQKAGSRATKPSYAKEKVVEYPPDDNPLDDEIPF